MALARQAGYATVVSARSGRDGGSVHRGFAVATGAGQIKIGSLSNSERLSKYNQLLRIAEDARSPMPEGRRSLVKALARGHAGRDKV